MVHPFLRSSRIPGFCSPQFSNSIISVFKEEEHLLPPRPLHGGNLQIEAATELGTRLPISLIPRRVLRSAALLDRKPARVRSCKKLCPC